MNTDHSKFWTTAARRQAAKFNVAWYLDCLSPWMFWGGLAAAAAVVLFRIMSWPSAILGILLAVGGLAALLEAWLRASKKFLNTREALARLDADLRLNNALTCAFKGLVPWPAPVPYPRFALDWKLGRVLAQSTAALAAFLAAFFVPLHLPSATPSQPGSEPGLWSEIQARVDEVREAEIVEPEALDAVQEALDALREQPPGEWFSHESLETGDHLRETTEAGLAALQQNLQAALGAMEASRQLEAAQLSALSEPLGEAMQKALEGLATGALPMDSKTLAQLKDFDPSKARSLTAEEWKELQAKLQKGLSTCSGGQCTGEGAGSELLAIIMGSQPGAGGVSCGPGSAPLTLNDVKTDLQTRTTETLENSDLSRAALGEIQGLTTGEHKVDDTSAGAGGMIALPRGAGETTSEIQATPSEQKALQSFFR